LLGSVSDERPGAWTLETSRLVLRPMEPGDFDGLYVIWRDPEVMQFIYPDGWPHSLETSRAAFDFLAGQFERDGFGQWVVVERERRAMIGYCGFKATPDPVVGELLYGLVTGRWGRGYATEAARAALAYGFGPAGFRRVVASAVVGHDASMRVLQKVGLERERVETVDGRAEVVFGLDRGRYKPGQET